MAQQKISYYSKKDFLYACTWLGLLLYGIYFAPPNQKIVYFSVALIMMTLYLFYWGLRLLSLKEYKGYQRFIGFRIVKGKEIKLQAILHIILGFLVIFFLGYMIASN